MAGDLLWELNIKANIEVASWELSTSCKDSQSISVGVLRDRHTLSLNNLECLRSDNFVNGGNDISSIESLYLNWLRKECLF